MLYIHIHTVINQLVFFFVAERRLRCPMRGRATHQTHMAAAREAARHQGHSVCAFGLVDTCRFLPIVYILTQWLVFQYFEFFYSNLCNKINPTKILVLNYIVNCSVIKDLNCLIFNTFKHFTYFFF